jgi:hypothetical protein
MTPRRGFGDEIWRLAQLGDADGLSRAAALFEDDDADVGYSRRRALAFGHAIHGRTKQALAELNQGWADDWPPPSAYALDVSRIHLLSGDCDRALSALQLQLHSLSHWAGVHEIVAACVRHDRRLWARGLRVALAAEPGGTGKLRAAAAVAGARFGH